MTWIHTLARLLGGPFRPPPSTRHSRLSRRTTHEVTIYLGEDNVIYVQHISMTGKGQADVAIRMCWEAMQHLAMSAGVGINLPSHAALPAQIVREPVEAGNGSA
jgi:hypothetical protein